MAGPNMEYETFCAVLCIEYAKRRRKELNGKKGGMRHGCTLRSIHRFIVLYTIYSFTFGNPK